MPAKECFTHTHTTHTHTHNTHTYPLTKAMAKTVDHPSVTALGWRETRVMEAIVKPLRQTIGSN